MSILDKKHILTINLDDSSIEYTNKIKFYNTDKNISNLYVKIKKTNNDEVTVDLNETDLKGLSLKLVAIKPKTNQFREITGVLTKELTEYTCAIYKFELSSEFTNQTGIVYSQFNLSDGLENGEDVTIDPFTYEIRASKLTGLNAEIISNPDLPILRQLIKEVQKTNYIDDTNISKFNTYSNEKIDNIIKDYKISVNEQFISKANVKDLQSGQKIARHTDGIYDNGTVLAIIANNDNPIAQVCGFKNGQDASKYENRDSVALYVQADSDSPIEVTQNVTYSSNSVTFTDELDYSKIKETMMLDTMHTTNRYTAFIESIDEINKTIYIKDGWWKVVQGIGSSSPETPPNGTGFYINLKTKIWGNNTNVVLREGDKVKVGVAEEIGLFNKNGGSLGGIDLVAFEGKSSYGFRARKTQGELEYGFRSEDSNIAFSSTSTDTTKVLIRNSVNGNYEKDGYEVLGDGKSNKLKLYTLPITNGVTSITDYKRKIWFFNKTISEEVTIPSPTDLIGEVIFINNIGSTTVTLRPNSGSVNYNGTVRGTLPCIPQSQYILISDGQNWQVFCNNTILPKFTTSSRPTGNLETGTTIIDSTLKKPIWRDGSIWRDFTGVEV